MGFKLNKQHIHTLDSFVSQVETLMEELACDSDTEHLLNQKIEDDLYTARYIVEQLTKEANGVGE
jgi:hypothetical protein